MKHQKKALIFSKNIVTVAELKRLLDILEVPEVLPTPYIDQACEITHKRKPAFVFIDLELPADTVEALVIYVRSTISTQLVLLQKKACYESNVTSIPEHEKLILLNKPIMLHRLNDIIHPYLSFGNLLKEARELVRKDAAKKEWI